MNKTLSQKRRAYRRGVKIAVMSLAFALYFTPRLYAVGQGIYNAWRIATIVVSIIVIFIYLSKGRITIRWSMLMLFLISYYVISKLLVHSDGSRTQMVFYLAETSGFITLLEYGLSSDREDCIKAFLIGGVCMCAWHYATFLMYRNYSYGMNFTQSSTYGELARHPYFLLTHDNGSIFYFLPVLCGIWFYVCELKRGFLLAITASAFVLYMYISLYTVTAMVVTTACVILFIALWFFDFQKLRSILNYKLALLIGVVICSMVIAFYSSDLLSSLASMFGKAEDLGRGRIWSRAFPFFMESPIFGNGFEQDTTTAFKLGINHCHNIIVQVLYTGGIVAAFFLAVGLLKCNQPIKKRDNPITKPQMVLCITIIAFFIAASFDWYLYMPVQFYPFILYRFSNSVLYGKDDGTSL